MDNPRFNITGKTLGELTDVLELILKREFDYPKSRSQQTEGYGYFTGYRTDPHLGLVLYQYPVEDWTTRFPFDEGKLPYKLAAFVYNYLESGLAEAVSIPPLPAHEGDYDDYADQRRDFEWDKDLIHDGHNSRGWRVFVGNWGHIPGHGHCAAYAIRPIFAWHGK